MHTGMPSIRSDDEPIFAFYRYNPSMGGAVLFTILFIGTTFYHIFQLFKTRTWFFIPFVIGGLFEIVGYIGRAASSKQSPDWTLGPYIVQTLCLLLAPALLAASIYMLLGRIILVLQAESHAILKKKWLTKVFVTGDVLSFILQGAGGGIQSSGSLDGLKTGERIIIVGLFVQIIFFGFFVVVAVLFDLKLRKYPIPRSASGEIPWRKHLNILYATSLLILVRSVFRLAEYIQGNHGYLLHHEVYLYVFDSLLIFIAMVVFNVVHPYEITRLLSGISDYELTGNPEERIVKPYGAYPGA
ncbi:RTA-like protein [Penicillium griseofulvum]|uniref:RTA-like protein n=1 Tax=Penicillium patulum TaxID=5078 RepID=A0A135LTY8_PENPA|nr:RTA-like protein [Penicillium griseofulvum]KXG52381.1 RTA-like protein [Penicillium griseofulvum]